MSTNSKTPAQQAFRLMLYRRPLHPELFNLASRRSDRHGDYEAETWVFPGGHVVRFSCKGDLATEAVVDLGDHLPETGLVHALPAFGEKDYECDAALGDITYVTSLQTENLADNLYHSTYQEMVDFAQETNAVSHAWRADDGSDCLSLVDIQKYKDEFHIQSYHLIGSTGFVLRTQSIFGLERN